MVVDLDEEKVRKLVDAMFEYKTRLFTSQNPVLSKKLLIFSMMSVQNSLQFVMDSRVLLMKGSYGHSVALAIFALEEVAKGVYCYYASKGLVDMKDFDKYTKKHEKKHKILSSLSIIALMKTMKKDLGMPKDFGQEISKQLNTQKEEEFWKELEKIRQRSLYVDFPDKSPTLFTKEVAESILTFASNWVLGFANFLINSCEEIHK